MVVQPISRTFSFCKTQTLYPLNNSHFPLPPSCGNHHSAFCLCEFHYSRYLIQVDGRFFNLRFPFCCSENCLSSATSYISLVLLFWTNVRSSKSPGIVIWQCSCQGKHEASQHSRREIQFSAAILRSGQAIWSHDRRSSLESQKYYQNVFLISEACLNPGFGRPFLCRSR